MERVFWVSDGDKKGRSLVFISVVLFAGVTGGKGGGPEGWGDKMKD